MKGVGLSLPNRGVLFGATTPREMLELAVAAEESEHFDSVWVGDGFLAKARMEAIVSLSAIASRTSRVQLGVCCLATFPLRQPALFALQWASLDLLSNGRTLLAVCLGARTSRSGGDVNAELTVMGVSADERVARFEENIEVLRALWSGPTEYQGRFTQFPEIELLPRPVQQPCPIWIASNPNPRQLSPARYAKAVDRVGRFADGWQTTLVAPEDFGARWSDIRSSAAKFGRDPDALSSSMHLMINVDNDEAVARSEAKRFLDTYYSMDVDDETMDRWGAYGPAEVVFGRVREYLGQGLDHPIIRFASFDQSAQIDRSSDSLLPELARLCRGRP